MLRKLEDTQFNIRRDKFIGIYLFLCYNYVEWRYIMIVIKNVSKSYDKRNKVIKDLNLRIEDGEIFGFLGPNGAGKSTTIKMITGILDIEDGEITINNHSIKNEPEEAKKCFGYVPDSPDMFLKLKGIEYLNFMAA